MLKARDSLVARVVSSAEEARSAASEGANLIILEVQCYQAYHTFGACAVQAIDSVQEVVDTFVDGRLSSYCVLQRQRGGISGEVISAAKTQQGSSGSIPVVAMLASPSDASAAARAGGDGAVLAMSDILQAGAAEQARHTTTLPFFQEGLTEWSESDWQGHVSTLSEMCTTPHMGVKCSSNWDGMSMHLMRYVHGLNSLAFFNLSLQVTQVLEAFRGSSSGEAGTRRPEDAAQKQPGEGLKHFLDASKEALLEAERDFLSKSLAFLQVRTVFC